MDHQTCPPHQVEEVRSNQGDDVATLYQARWGSIMSHFWETLRGVRSVYNFRTPIDCILELIFYFTSLKEYRAIYARP